MTERARYKQLGEHGNVHELSQQAWADSCSRNSSGVTNLFRGQLQSTLTCPACSAESHKFEDFQDVCLPLPQVSSLSLEVRSYGRSLMLIFALSAGFP